MLNKNICPTHTGKGPLGGDNEARKEHARGGGVRGFGRQQADQVAREATRYRHSNAGEVVGAGWQVRGRSREQIADVEVYILVLMFIGIKIKVFYDVH